MHGGELMVVVLMIKWKNEEKQFRWGLIFRCAGERSEGHGCDDNDGVWVT